MRRGGRLSDRAVMLSKGVAQQVDTPDKLYREPVTPMNDGGGA
jgi:ABC-type sugar transport system ATPase subunit